MRKVILLSTIIITSLTQLYAVPAKPGSTTIIQPDGSTLTIVLSGDEHRKIRKTTDGFVVKKNAAGFYTYAETDNQNQYIPGSRVAKDPETRTPDEQSYVRSLVKPESLKTSGISGPSKIRRISSASSSTGFPKTGSPKSLVIMVNFSDKSFVVPTPQTAFTNLLNQTDYAANGGTGSAKDYFMAASNGQFSPQFDVVGPYTLTNTMAYYGANDADGYDVKPAYMIIDACKAADNAGVNFAQYDTDNDGYVDNVFVYYAGYNEAEGFDTNENTIWPHRWAVVPGDNFTNNTSLVRFDGKTVFDYACTSELKNNTGSDMCGIGTFTHEFGHVIGLPDYYHTEADKNTLQTWSIMDAGAYNNYGRTPPTYSAYDRFYLGWLTPQQLSTPSNKSLYPLSQSRSTGVYKNQAYLISATNHNLSGTSPSPTEFFIMEYRKKTGWDSWLPAEGLLFWHIDYNQTAWDNNTPNNYTGTTQTAASHMRVYLQPLVGSTTTPGTAFTSGSFIPTTWSGTNINREITAITKTTDSISFKLMGGDPTQSTNVFIGIINSKLQFPVTKVNKTNAKYLNIKTTDVNANLSVSITGANATMFTASSSSLTLANVNSTNGAGLDITYVPTSAGDHTAILTISGGGLNPEKVIELKGTAVE
jgi:M6 family metalloprotease-like protein